MSKITSKNNDLKKLERQLKKKKQELQEQGFDEFFYNRCTDKLDRAKALNQQIKTLEDQKRLERENTFDKDRPLHRESDHAKRQFVAEEKKKG